ncbi:MAG: trigger factor [Myxococcales bacterium]|nr:trigger factor [Myxococcales bacterium]MCB9641933.1 trigger factor [Myxococcales bacterium]
MKIDIKIDEVSPVEKRVQFSIDSNDVDEILNEIFQQLSRNVRLKGFRPGKVPRKVFEQLPQYRTAIQEEARKRLLESSFAELFKDESLEVLSIPSADNGDAIRGKDYVFNANVEVRPFVDLSKTGEMTVNVEEIEFSDEDVEKEIERERERLSSLRDVEDRAAQDGDILKVNYTFKQGEDTRNRENVQVRLGSASGVLPKEAEEALLGMKAEEEKDIEIPAEDAETQHFHLKVVAIQERVLPELDDEMAVDAGYENLEDMRAKVRGKLEEDAKERCANRAKTRLLRQLGEACDVNVPPNFLNNHIDSKLREMLMQFRMFMQNDKMMFDPSVMRETIRDDAFHEVRHGIILQQAIRDFDIKAEESEVDEELSEIAKKQNRSVAYLKSAYSEEDLNNIKREIQNRKAVDLLFDKVAHQIEKLSAEALQERIKEEREAKEAEREAQNDASEDNA